MKKNSKKYHWTKTVRKRNCPFVVVLTQRNQYGYMFMKVWNPKTGEVVVPSRRMAPTDHDAAITWARGWLPPL